MPMFGGGGGGGECPCLVVGGGVNAHVWWVGVAPPEKSKFLLACAAKTYVSSKLHSVRYPNGKLQLFIIFALLL